MLGTLLIICKNGRTVKTYGLNRWENYNMKFAFLCVVIIISCSVCASDDLEIYPGIKLDLSPEDQRRAELHRRWPLEYEDRRKNLDFILPKRLRDFQEYLDRARIKNEDYPFYYNRKDSFDDAIEEYKNLEAARKLARLNNYPTQQLQDRQDDDFTFGEVEDEEEEGGDINKEVMDSPRHYNKQMGRTTEEASGKGDFLGDVKFVEDPTQFAYPPTDPRYFQSTESDVLEEVQTTPLKQPNKFPTKINLQHRSDERFSEENDFVNSRSGDNHLEVVAVKPSAVDAESAGVYIIAVVAGISAAATVGLIAVGIGWYNLQKHVKSASDVEYPAYGVTGPNKDSSPSGDRRLAQSAQMYHYQHQKQQIIAMESRAVAGDRHGSVSEADSDEENEEGDYTVYECPGLAPTGEMEVKNPLFQDDPTPAQTPPLKPTSNEKK